MSRSVQDIYNSLATDDVEKVANEINGSQENADFDFNVEFFDSLADEDPDSIEKISSFIDAARSEGYEDDQIQARIEEIETEVRTKEASLEGADEDVQDYEIEEGEDFDKVAEQRYWTGAGQAIEDFLGSDFAKEAGITMEDLQEFELGEHEGAGYFNAMQELRVRGEKIAAAKGGMNEEPTVEDAVSFLESQGYSVSDNSQKTASAVNAIMSGEKQASSNEDLDTAVAILQHHGIID
jgi:hypothetical protein